MSECPDLVEDWAGAVGAVIVVFRFWKEDL